MVHLRCAKYVGVIIHLPVNHLITLQQREFSLPVTRSLNFDLTYGLFCHYTPVDLPVVNASELHPPEMVFGNERIQDPMVYRI